jgi:hypothetical protein
MEAFSGQKAELVVCDGAPDVTGFHDIDQYIQSQLLVSALNICTKTITHNGTFVTKIFQGSDSVFLKSQFKVFFKQVDIFKPKSSRESSVENFLVAQFYDPPKGFCLTDINTFKVFNQDLIDHDKFFTQQNLAIENPETPAEPEMTESKLKDKERQINGLRKLNKNIYNFVTCGDLGCYDEEVSADSDAE